MAYTHGEDLGGMGEDRQLSILTTANIVGAVVGGVIVWQGSAFLGFGGDTFTPGWWLQWFMIFLGMGIGIMLTIRWGGLSAIERMMDFASYQSRKMSGDTILHPEYASSNQNAGQQGLISIYREGEDQAVVRPYVPSTSRQQEE